MQAFERIVRDHLHALPHISHGYFIGPGFGWQSDAFDVSRAKIYNRCDVEPFFGAIIMKCLLCDHALILLILDQYVGIYKASYLMTEMVCHEMLLY